MLRGHLILLITVLYLPYLTNSTNEQQLQCGEPTTGRMINKTEQIQSIANYILKLLGYNMVPNVPSKSTPKRNDTTAYHIQMQRGTDRDNQGECNADNTEESLHAKSVITIPSQPMHLQSASESGSGSDTKRASGDHNIGGDIILASYDIEFGIGAIPKHPHLVELMIFKEKSNSNSIPKQDDLFQLVEVIEKSNTSLGKVISVKVVDAFSPKGYIRFDVTKAAVRWIQQRLRKIALTLTVKCISSSLLCDLRSENQVKFSTSTKQMRHPYLVVETYINSKDKNSQPTLENKRRKRSSKFCNNGSQICCLKELKVNFVRDLGWNFIILPEEIYVNYCHGLCPLGTDVTPEQFVALAKIHSSAQPCCSGATYEPVSMLVEHVNGTFDLLEVPRLTVTSCRCG